MICDADFGPLHPYAVAVITDNPVQPAIYVTSPVDGLMVLPAARLAPFKLYDIEVASVAVALYVTELAPEQRVEEAPILKTGVPTVFVEITVCVAVSVLPQPEAVAVITVVPVQVLT